MKKLLLTIGIMVLLTCSLGANTLLTLDGYTWEGLDYEEKLNFLAGYLTAVISIWMTVQQERPDAIEVLDDFQVENVSLGSFIDKIDYFYVTHSKETRLIVAIHYQLRQEGA